MNTPATLPLPDATPFTWGNPASAGTEKKRDFTRKVNALLIALQDAAGDFQDIHPDRAGKRDETWERLQIAGKIAGPFSEIMEAIMDRVDDDLADEVTTNVRELNAVIAHWEKTL